MPLEVFSFVCSLLWLVVRFGRPAKKTLHINPLSISTKPKYNELTIIYYFRIIYFWTNLFTLFTSCKFMMCLRLVAFEQKPQNSKRIMESGIFYLLFFVLIRRGNVSNMWLLFWEQHSVSKLYIFIIFRAPGDWHWVAFRSGFSLYCLDYIFFLVLWFFLY